MNDALTEIQIRFNDDERLRLIKNVPDYTKLLQILKSQHPETARSDINLDKKCKDMLPHDWNYVPAKVRPTGNCLYGAISVALTGSEDFADLIRLAELELVISNKRNLEYVANKVSALSILGTTYDSLVENTSKCGVWGSEPNILLATAVINRPIHIISFSFSGKLEAIIRYNANEAHASNRPVQLILYGPQESRHFQPLLPLSADEPTVQCATQGVFCTNIDENFRIRTDRSGQTLDQSVVGIYDFDTPADEICIIEPTTPAPSITTVAPSTAQNEEVGVLDVSAAAPRASEPSSNETVQLSPTDRSFLQSIAIKLDDLGAAFSKLLIRDQAKTSKKVQRPSDAILQAKTVASILDLYPDLRLKHGGDADLEEESFTSIECSICFDGEKLDKTGEFSYSSSHGMDFSKCSKLPRKFVNFRRNVKNHMMSLSHLKKAEELEKLAQRRREMQKRNESAGMNCGRLAYNAIKVDADSSKYEYSVAMAHKLGSLVGDLNHSRKFCASFRTSAYNVLCNQTVSQMNQVLKGTRRPPPISIFADKYTPNRQTGQVIGVTTFMNDKINTLFVGFVKPASHNAQGLATGMLEPVQLMFGENLKDR